MTILQHLVGPTLLLAPADLPSLSVLTYNVLLPNSIDGWWNYKMYNPPLSSANKHVSTWEYRQQLLKERIAAIDADVVCLQEVSPLSFEDDFRFMTEELGYTGNELFKRGRFRPATFWKRCELVAPAVHKDRTLLTAFRRHEQTWYVLNCHLQAGAEARRRVRQIQEGTKAVVTLARKLKDVEPDKFVKLIVCGDFNGGHECAAIRYLEDGAIDETFREDGGPVVSSRKELPFQHALKDVFADWVGTDAPPTLIVAELISIMVEHGSAYSESPQFTPEVLQRLERVFDQYASHRNEKNDDERTMTANDVERWLVAINGQVGRGSEFREAARQMGWKEEDEDENSNGHDDAVTSKKQIITLPVDGYLTLAGFIQVYESELRGGKFWGIAHDLAVLGEPLPDAGVFQSRYDRIYGSASIQPSAVMHFASNVPCPNANEPSDHLPVAACFVVSSAENSK